MTTQFIRPNELRELLRQRAEDKARLARDAAGQYAVLLNAALANEQITAEHEGSEGEVELYRCMDPAPPLSFFPKDASASKPEELLCLGEILKKAGWDYHIYFPRPGNAAGRHLVLTPRPEQP